MGAEDTIMTVHANFPAAELPERRSGTNRRCRHVQAFFWQFFKARRVGQRRLYERQTHYYVDVHEAGLLLVILLILKLCVIDAYLTLTLLNNGAVEINPFMQAALENGSRQFFYTKYSITASSLIILLMHKNYRVFGYVSVQNMLFVLLFTYTLLVSYEIGLLAHVDLLPLGDLSSAFSS